jgi:16S rRNA (guanine966-N2)-methyltransferase
MFAILASRIDDSVVLDLYAGSGALGFEALSRGARFATFVDSNPDVVERLREAAIELGVKDQAEILPMRAERAVSRLDRQYDIVFVDPPYAMGFPAVPLQTLEQRGLLTEDAVIIFEHSSHMTPQTPGFTLSREERYGDVVIAFLHPESPNA